MNTEQLSEKLIAAYNELGNCDGIIVLSDLPGGSPFRTAVESSMPLPENPWYYEVQDLGRLAAEADYDACYAHLNTTLEVVRVLEQARKYAGFDF